jgi:hypothetical protein
MARAAKTTPTAFSRLPRLVSPRAWVCIVFCWAVAVSLAHQPGESYLNLRIEKEKLTGQWDIALRDLEQTIGLDANHDGSVTWEELRARQKQIGAYALAHLKLKANDALVTPVLTEPEVAEHPDGVYTVVNFEATHLPHTQSLEVTYRLFFKEHPQHRGLMNLSCGSTNDQLAVFSPARMTQRFECAVPSRWREFTSFGGEGVWHIWMGFDHILFLLALLLPSVLRRDGGRWVVQPAFRPAFVSVLRIVTAFTIAHSITLSLAAAQAIELPSRLVESVIAASVVLAAANNLYPVVQDRGWLVAFGFGLIHGFGFASVLTEFGVKQGALLLPLVGFNLGVELGQLVIVMLFLPFAFALRGSWFYQHATLRIGSMAVMVISSTWMFERLFDFRVLPF